jgi:REP-associated tyrosine transposase
MPRPRRTAPGGLVYHVLNRANGRREIFQSAADYRAFENALAEIQQRVPMRVLAWCLMPNHWHLLLWPKGDGDLSNYMRLVTLTHTQRWHAFRRSAGTGHLYQGRFKSFVVQHDGHFLTVCRYVEANALRASLVGRAEKWRWCSLSQQCEDASRGRPRLHEWPVARPRDWTEYVNEAAKPADLEALRRSAQRGTPYGQATWVEQVAGKLGLRSTLRPPGRPKKKRKENEKGS